MGSTNDAKPKTEVYMTEIRGFMIAVTREFNPPYINISWSGVHLSDNFRYAGEKARTGYESRTIDAQFSTLARLEGVGG